MSGRHNANPDTGEHEDDDPEVRTRTERLAEDFGEDPEELEQQAAEFDIEHPSDTDATATEDADGED